MVTTLGFLDLQSVRSGQAVNEVIYEKAIFEFRVHFHNERYQGGHTASLNVTKSLAESSHFAIEKLGTVKYFNGVYHIYAFVQRKVEVCGHNGYASAIPRKASWSTDGSDVVGTETITIVQVNGW